MYIKSVCFLTLVYLVQEVYLTQCFDDDDSLTRIICFTFFANLLTLALYNITKYYNLPFPYRVVVIVFGMIFGLIAKAYHPLDDEVTQSVLIQPENIFMIALPIIVFRIAFNIDVHTFVRAWLQVLVLGVPGYILTSCFIGVMLMLLMPNVTMSNAILIGSMISPTYPTEIIDLLDGIGHFKYLTVLLKGEILIGDATIFVLFHVTHGVITGELNEWYHVCLVFFRFILGGIIFGYLCGYVLQFLMRTVNSDSVTVSMLLLAWSFITYVIAAKVLLVSRIIAIVVVGIKAAEEKTSMSTDIETFVTNFWELLAFFVDTVICILAGFLLVRYTMVDGILEMTSLVLVSFIICTTGRILSYIFLIPIVSRLGYGMTFKEMVIAVWSGLKGPFPLLLGLLASDHAVGIGKHITSYISFLILLTLLVNGTTMPYLLKILGVSEVSDARKMNMNNCIRNLRSTKERTIATLKMDRFLSDANWSVVNEATEIEHPYKINYSDGTDESDVFFYNRPVKCSDCKKEFPYEPSKIEMTAKLREARLRILKAKKMCYTRQYEAGLLSKDGIRILLQAVETAMDSSDGLIELEGLHRYFKRQGFAHYARKKLLVQFFNKSYLPAKPPRRYYRKMCYNVVTNTGFELFIFACIIILTIFTCFEIFHPPERGTGFYVAIVIVNVLLFLVFLIEFLLKIFAFSWIYLWEHGVKWYFSSYWNIFDFCYLVLLFADVLFSTLNLLYSDSDKYKSSTYTAFLIIKLCRISRFLRMLTLCNWLYPRLIVYCDSKIDENSAFAYDIGKGVVTGEEEVATILSQMVDNAIVRDVCRARIEADRLVITKELGLVQRDKPWIAVTVKTRQAAQSTINSMRDGVRQLKLSGVVDDFEYTKLIESFEYCSKLMRYKLKSVQPCSPKEIFKEVSWIAGNDQISEYLYNNVATKVFDQGDDVCTAGELSDNVYILVLGIFKLTYKPKSNVTDMLSEYGALPVIDYIKSFRFDIKYQDYILSGNTIGELSILTNRPYDCTIVAELPSQAYFLSKKVLNEAFVQDPDPFTGLEARMWKFISIRLASTILMETTLYQTTPFEQINYLLERGFVLNMKKYKVFYVNNLVEDIVLIEGIIIDNNTKIRYTAPCYVPRTVQEITFSTDLSFLTIIEPKLLIIPAKEVVNFDVITRFDDVSEMISAKSSRCLLHTVQNHISQRKKELGPNKFYKEESRLNRSSISFFSEVRDTNETRGSRHFLGDYDLKSKISSGDKRGSFTNYYNGLAQHSNVSVRTIEESDEDLTEKQEVKMSTKFVKLAKPNAAPSDNKTNTDHSQSPRNIRKSKKFK